MNIIDKSIESLEKELELPESYMEELLKEDDWSFVIKLHAIFEAAVTKLIIDKLGQNMLSDFVSLIEMSNSKVGKLAIVKALKLLDKNERKFIKKLSEIRNRLVHKVSNINFDFTKYAKGLDKNQKEAHVEAFGFIIPEGMNIKGNHISQNDMVLQNMKISIWLLSIQLLGYIYQKKELYKTRRAYEKAFLKHYKTIENRSDEIRQSIGDASNTLSWKHKKEES